MQLIPTLAEKKIKSTRSTVGRGREGERRARLALTELPCHYGAPSCSFHRGLPQNFACPKDKPPFYHLGAAGCATKNFLLLTTSCQPRHPHTFISQLWGSLSPAARFWRIKHHSKGIKPQENIPQLASAGPQALLCSL